MAFNLFQNQPIASKSVLPNFAEEYNKPQSLAAKLLDAQLTNKINKPKADDAQGWYNAQKQALQSETGLRGAQLNKYLMDIQVAQSNMDFLKDLDRRSGGGYNQLSAPNSSPSYNEIPPYTGYDNSDRNVSAEGPGVAASTSNRDTFPGRITRPSQPQPQPQPQQELFSQIPAIPAFGEKYAQVLNRPQLNQKQSGLGYAPPNITYQDVLREAQLRGLPPPPIEKINGQLVAVTQRGLIPIAQGLTKTQEALAGSDAKHIENLENIVIGSDVKRDVLDEVSSITADPLFKQMRQNPLLNQYELQAFAKIGTPEQQAMVGKMTALMGNLISASARDFAGQFRTGEQKLLESMKPSMADTIPVMQGKLEAWQVMNDMMTERARLEADYMRQYQMPPLKAREAANLVIDKNKIRGRINNILHPKPRADLKHLSDAELARIAGE